MASDGPHSPLCVNNEFFRVIVNAQSQRRLEIIFANLFISLDARFDSITGV